MILVTNRKLLDRLDSIERRLEDDTFKKARKLLNENETLHSVLNTFYKALDRIALSSSESDVKKLANEALKKERYTVQIYLKLEGE